jgi:hypothetical protein
MTTTEAAHTAGPVSKRWNTTSQALGHGEQWCTCCERPLEGHAIRMLELDQRTDTYHDFRDVPEAKSQGWFPFGLKCAAKLVRAAAEATTNG